MQRGVADPLTHSSTIAERGSRRVADGRKTGERLFDQVGSRWWKVDFHAHSPGSFDFGAPKEGQKSRTTTSYEEWLQTYMDANIDAVVITDHNGFSGIDLARQALSGMQGKPGSRDLVLLAGVELTVAGGIHLLGVFDADTDSEVIRKVIDLAGYEGAYGESTVAASQSLSSVSRLIHERGGLAVPAHADNHAGVLMQTGTGLAEIEAKAPIFAIETIDPATTFERPGFRKLVRVLGSDAHHLDGSNCPAGETAKYPGSHYTWVKMETPTLEGIRNAISDGKSSVIPSDGQAVLAPSTPKSAAYPSATRPSTSIRRLTPSSVGEVSVSQRPLNSSGLLWTASRIFHRLLRPNYNGSPRRPLPAAAGARGLT